MSTELTGRVAVITGGARGLGLSIAEALAARGARIALLDVLESVADSAAGLAARHRVETVGLQLDVTDQQAVDDRFGEIAARLGVADILVTAAGITIWGDSVDVPAEQWRKVFAVNLDGTFFTAQAFARGLLGAERPGSAVFVSSMSAHIVNVPQAQASYNASKAAVSHLARSLAVEWAPSAIRVNAISPGYFLSDMTRQFTEQNPQLAADWVSRIPVGRMGEPADLHGLVAFLASDASVYLTGQDLIIDGGYTAI